jgi:hypothetical protein
MFQSFLLPIPAGVRVDWNWIPIRMGQTLGEDLRSRMLYDVCRKSREDSVRGAKRQVVDTHAVILDDRRSPLTSWLEYAYRGAEGARQG